MNALTVRLETVNYAVAEVEGKGGRVVKLDIARATNWDADGLEELAELLIGVAQTLRAKMRRGKRA